jgi:hypothetical protein
VVHHRRLARADRAVDQRDLRLAEQELERVLLALIVDAAGRLVQPPLDGCCVAVDTRRRVLRELLDDCDGVVLVPADEDVALVLQELALRVQLLMIGVPTGLAVARPG